MEARDCRWPECASRLVQKSGRTFWYSRDRRSARGASEVELSSARVHRRACGAQRGMNRTKQRSPSTVVSAPCEYGMGQSNGTDGSSVGLSRSGQALDSGESSSV
eukprot:scaffold4201_cov119-Isochrysis_galbana.AAC.5